MDSHELKEILEFATHLAREAGKVTLEYFGATLNVDRKSDRSPVTVADQKAEERLRTLISTQFPEHGILGEEFGEEGSGGRFRWIVDPIDGTRSFIRGVPLYGVLVALEHEGDAMVGVIHHPALGETVRAAKGCGCDWNGRPARVSDVEDLAEAMVLTTDTGDVFRKNRTFTESLLSELSRHRTWGDCYGYTLVATGRAEVMMDPRMALWDSAALKPVIEESGGIFTDWSGKRTIYGDDALAANRRLHHKVLKMLQASISV